MVPDLLTQDTSDQSAPDSSDTETEDTVLKEKAHPWLPNWSWVQDHTWWPSPLGGGLSITPQQKKRGKKTPPTTPRSQSTGKPVHASIKREVPPITIVPLLDNVRDRTFKPIEVQGLSRGDNRPAYRSRGRQHTKNSWTWSRTWKRTKQE